MRALIDEYAPKVVVLDLGAVPDLEYTALRMLTDGEETRREAGTMLWLVGMNPDVLAVVQRSPLWTRLGRERMFFNLEQAVIKYQQQAEATTQEPVSRG
jgi:MFS superfamily sulfate permease-like transporter